MLLARGRAVALLCLFPVFGPACAQSTAADPAGATAALPEASLAPTTPAPAAEASKAGSDGDDETKIDCRHGVFKNKVCDCYDNWGHAGITDTINFLEGVCDQYKCTTDELCAAHLHFPGSHRATCPVKGWNCLCPFPYAFYGWGHGYEDDIDKPGGAACMGIMWSFALVMSETTEYFFVHAWKIFGALAVVMLPFGRKRNNCDHHSPSLWKLVKSSVLCIAFCGQRPHESCQEAPCNGACINNAEATWWDKLQDDFAWSIYVIDLMIWFYVFIVVVWASCLMAWSILLLMIVITLLVCALLALAVLGAAQACLSGEACDCCTGCDAAACNCNPCECCAICCQQGHLGGAAGGGLDLGGSTVGGMPQIFWMPQPSHDPCCCDSCCRGCGCDCPSSFQVRRVGCGPIAHMLYVYPSPPENAWGGLLGRLWGTHISTDPDHVYMGNNQFIDFFAMRWRNLDARSNALWRQQVLDALYGSEEEARQEEQRQRQGQTPNQVQMGTGARPQETRRNPFVPRSYELETGQTEGGMQRFIQGRNVYKMERDTPFERHECVDSSWGDYVKGDCWICMAKAEKKWDLWMSCKHIFCENCSTELLRRNMPCALCRVASNVVFRAPKYTERAENPPSNAAAAPETAPLLGDPAPAARNLASSASGHPPVASVSPAVSAPTPAVMQAGNWAMGSAGAGAQASYAQNRSASHLGV